MTAFTSRSVADVRREFAETPMTGFQVGTVAICLLINLIDGFDVLAISFAASHLSREWQLSPTELGLLFSSGVAGMTLSSIVIAPVADYFGRRLAILAFLVVVSFAMAASALASSAGELAAWRFVTGIGVGGLLPSLNTLVAEFASRKRQELAVSIMQGGFPLGATFGGMVALLLIDAFGWRSIFWVGAGMSAIMIPVVWLRLPESLDFLLARRDSGALERVNRLLVRLGREPLETLDTVRNISPPIGLRALATPGLAARIVTLSISFFFVMGCFYFVSAWTPKLLIDAGLAVSGGISGGIILNVAGVAGGILLAWVASGAGVRKLTMAYMLLAALAMAAFGLMSNLWPLLIMAGVLGFFLVGTMMGLYSLMPALFPTGARATAAGFAIGMGRFGAMAGPVLTGLLLEARFDTSTIYMLFALPMIAAAAALFVLHRLAASPTGGSC